MSGARILSPVFEVERRDLVRDRVLELAASDPRVVSAAAVGSLAGGRGDRWSDLDLTFGLADGTGVSEVLDDFTRAMAEEFEGVPLLDLVVRGTTYRVFLLPDWLQVDLSFAPSPVIQQGGPSFQLLFGRHEVDYAPPPSADDLFGWAVVFARATRVAVERRQWWQAEHHVSAVRDRALTLACLRRGLPTAYGRGFDELPGDVLDAFRGALVRSLDRDELLRALASAVDGLLREAADVDALASRIDAQLRALTPAPS